MNEGRRVITVVITTKFGISTSSHMLGDRWRQQVVTCLAFISGTKPCGHSFAHTSSKDFESRLVLWRLKYFTSWISAA